MKKVISLSKHLGITRKQLEDHNILDIDLGVDTRFFVDPVLLRNSKIPEFFKSREVILNYFSELIRMIKVSNLSSQMKEKTINKLAVKEPQGLSIGYGGKTDKGIAIPKNVARKMINTMVEIIQIGIEDPEIVEILSMFVSGYGPDSISDLTVHIIYEDFCCFTQRKCKELGVKTKEFKYSEEKYFLPQHPFNKSPILFIPTTILSPLPVASDWEGVKEAASFNENLRTKTNEIVFQTLLDDIYSSRKKSPEEIAQIKNRLNSLIDVYKEVEVSPYDLSTDPSGFYSISPEVEKVSHSIKPTNQPKNNEELLIAVKELLSQFKKSIEDNGLNKCLFDQNGLPHREEIAQLVLYSIADLYCSFTNILLSRESNGGRGPVDFSLGTGYENKIILEVKKSNNKNLISGYEKQIVAYQKSESAFRSFYLVIVVSKRKKDDQLSIVEKKFNDGQLAGEKLPYLFIIDGLRYPSPSNLK